ncbi:unnamed protein product [Effrenium voratum]|nr:unnamed protein product [Effrenium voratum]
MELWPVAIAMALGTASCLLLLGSAELALLRTLLKMLACKGRRNRGQLTGLRFPTSADELTSSKGPARLTAMLKPHLPKGVSVTSVRNLQTEIKDGVKGEKAMLKVTYSKPVDAEILPTVFFVKFNLQDWSPMRIFVQSSQVCKCEALFYHILAKEISDFLRTPKCFFVDFNEMTGEFCLVTEALDFGNQYLPLKHRVRDAASLEDQLLFIETGAMLHCRLGDSPVLLKMPKFHETHREMWVLCGLSGRFGLSHSVQKTVRGQRVNEAWMTWDCPSELLGKERDIIRDMPGIMTSLSKDPEMAVFGHNDLTTDNAFYWKDAGKLHMGLFDWQQSCVNNLGQEWAWNWHFLEPEFLAKHEETLIDHVLSTYERLGRQISRAKFLNAYVLGTAQMFVFSGGGLQLLMRQISSPRASSSPWCRRTCDAKIRAWTRSCERSWWVQR